MPNDPTDIAAAALLDEPVRRALYDCVVRASRAVSRDEAASVVDVSRALAAFHLDRLARAGLLVAEYRRLSGRTGPGAGRPAKLYRLGPREIVVSLPDRRYEVPARLFASAMEQMGGPLPPDALRAAARQVGQAVGSAARKHAGPRLSRKRLRSALCAALEERGYRPLETSSGEIRLGNCPFNSLVDDHREIVCGMNLALVDGLLEGLGDRARARSDRQPDQCCVVVGSMGRARAKVVERSG